MIFDHESPLVRFSKGLPAGQATKAPKAVPVISETLGCVAASGTIHRSGCCFFRFHDSIIQQQAVVYKGKMQFWNVFFRFIFNGLRGKIELPQKRGKAPETATCGRHFRGCFVGAYGWPMVARDLGASSNLPSPS
jgi:hypothetical protein